MDFTTLEHGTTDQNLGHDTLNMQSQAQALLPQIMYYDIPAQTLAQSVALETLGLGQASTALTLDQDIPSQNLGHTWAMDHLENVQMIVNPTRYQSVQILQYQGVMWEFYNTRVLCGNCWVGQQPKAETTGIHFSQVQWP